MMEWRRSSIVRKQPDGSYASLDVLVIKAYQHGDVRGF